jgi:protein gp37
MCPTVPHLVWQMSERGLIPLRNVWLGVSVESQKYADERIPLLLQTPAAVRFLSVEPQLEAVSLAQPAPGHSRHEGLVDPTNLGVDWVIVGGESGPGARPFNLAWAESLQAQCKAAGVAFFMKQVGSVPMMSDELWRTAPTMRLLSCANRNSVPDGYVPLKTSDRKGGDMSEWPESLRVREFPA